MRARHTRIDPGLERVIAAAKTLTALAHALGLTPQTVSQWQRVPVERVLEVERLTGVPRHVQRPDIYPAEPRRPLARRRRGARAEALPAA